MKLQKVVQVKTTASGKAERRGEQGFTLIETVIALLILLIASMGVATLFVYAVRNNFGGENRTLAAAVAQQHIERFRGVTFDGLAAAVTATGGTSKTVTHGSRSFRVNTTITDGPTVTGTVRIKTITVDVTPIMIDRPWDGGTFSITTQRSTLTAGPYK